MADNGIVVNRRYSVAVIVSSSLYWVAKEAVMCRSARLPLRSSLLKPLSDFRRERLAGQSPHLSPFHVHIVI